MNKNKGDFSEKEFNGVTVKTTDGKVVGKLETLQLREHRNSTLKKVFELNYGNFKKTIHNLMLIEELKKANAKIFLDRYRHHMSEEETRKFMEKYSVQIDPEKVEQEKEKVAHTGKPSPTHDPNINVPKDPKKGTEPFEKKPE